VAVTRSGNSIYVDGTGSYTFTGTLKVKAIILTPSTHGAGSPYITLKDLAQSPHVKVSLATVNTDSRNEPLYDMEFFGGINVSTLSGAVATIILSG